MFYIPDILLVSCICEGTMVAHVYPEVDASPVGDPTQWWLQKDWARFLLLTS